LHYFSILHLPSTNPAANTAGTTAIEQPNTSADCKHKPGIDLAEGVTGHKGIIECLTGHFYNIKNFQFIIEHPRTSKSGIEKGNKKHYESIEKPLKN
jgi:hypothetical protein